MTTLKHFFIGLLLLIATFGMVFFATFIYQANEKSSIKTYIFQMNNIKNQRVGALQNIDDISAIDLRNKLIKKYVSEYFKVIPGTKNLTDNPTLQTMSTQEAYEHWKKNIGPEISRMSSQNQFRIVVIPEDGIATIDMPNGYDYYNAVIPRPIFYSVKYYTMTWQESNVMAVEPITENGIIYIQALFKPGLFEKTKVLSDDGKVRELNVQQYLESGKDPAVLFKFEVTNIDDGNK